MSDAPIVRLSNRTRGALVTFLVVLAVAHVIWPDLAIDGVFLGLIAMAGVVYYFDIHSVDALGLKARARELREVTQALERAPLPSEELTRPLPAPPSPTGAPAHLKEVTLEPVHREPVDLMPPTERVSRILWAVEQLRVELIIIAGSSGHLPAARPWSSYRIRELGDLLAAKGVLPDEFVKPMASILEARNALAHGQPLTMPVLESVDEAAMTLLARLREVPRTYFRIVDPMVPLFLDQSLTTRHPYTGVMLEHRDRDGKLERTSVFPTATQYQRGRFVTWEWDLSQGSDQEAWYSDRNTNKPVCAFVEAAAFAGREFPDQFALRYRAGPLLDD